MFENVPGLLRQQHREFFEFIENRVAEEGYELHVELLDTRFNGLPQSRPRVYMVGLRRDLLERRCSTNSFAFPAPVQGVDLAGFLDPRGPGDSPSRLPPPRQRHNRSRVSAALASAAANGLYLVRQDIVMDCDASASRSHPHPPVAPTLTRSRIQGLWVLSRGRRVRPHEAVRLQGIHPSSLSLPSDSRCTYALAGNAMSTCLLGRVVHRALDAVGLPAGADTWASGMAQAAAVREATAQDNGTLDHRQNGPVRPPKRVRQEREARAIAANRRFQDCLVGTARRPPDVDDDGRPPSISAALATVAATRQLTLADLWCPGSAPAAATSRPSEADAAGPAACAPVDSGAAACRAPACVFPPVVDVDGSDATTSAVPSSPTRGGDQACDEVPLPGRRRCWAPL